MKESLKDEADPKKPKGRKGRNNIQRAQAEKDKPKNTLQSSQNEEGIEAAAAIDEPKNLKQKILKWMDHNAYVATMIVLTVLALFMIDMVLVMAF